MDLRVKKEVEAVDSVDSVNSVDSVIDFSLLMFQREEFFSSFSLSLVSPFSLGFF